MLLLVFSYLVFRIGCLAWCTQNGERAKAIKTRIFVFFYDLIINYKMYQTQPFSNIIQSVNARRKEKKNLLFGQQFIWFI